MTRNCRLWLPLSALLAVAWSCGESGGEKEADAGSDTSGESPCPWDDDDDSGRASTLTASGEKEGFLCPRGDRDWYEFTVPAGSDLAAVKLALDAPVSPVNPTYSIWGPGAKDVVAAPDADESAKPSAPLEVVHGLTSGEYLLSVRDLADDAEDVRHPYVLSVSFSKDKDAFEPNNDQAQATPAGEWEGPQKGYISFRGDEDWYLVDAKARNILELNLTMPAGGVELAYRIIDPAGEVLVEGANEAGKREATELSYRQALEAAGTYYVVISDDDTMDHDGENAYEIALTRGADPDQNEANDTLSQSTSIDPLACGDAWTEWSEKKGYIGSSGDVDWYHVEAQNCGRGLIEAEVQFDESGSLPEDLQASIRVVRTVPQMSCQADQDCATLTTTCNTHLDCSGIGNTCLASGFCAGGGVCTPAGLCGANLLSVSAAERVSSSSGQNNGAVNPDRGTARLAVPTLGDSADFYIAVEDYHSDAHSPDVEYTFRVRTRRDPDTHERSEAYTAGLIREEDEDWDTPAQAQAHIRRAKAVPVHDCVTGDCCGANTWIEGFLSYTYDQDWYAYPHPCEGADCMVRILYELEGGPVDFHMQIYQGETLWFDTVLDITDRTVHSASTGTFGGLNPEDDCFYAYQGHSGDSFSYYLAVRDTVYKSEQDEEGGTWDWHADQPYRFCIEKVADGCQAPCELKEGGCDVPFTGK